HPILALVGFLRFVPPKCGASTRLIAGDAIVSALRLAPGAAMTLELKMLTLSIVLGLVQIVLASHVASLQRGYAWIASSRDEVRPALAAGTNIPPNLPTTALVVDGIYERTRNPLYLGSTLVYLGLSVAAGSLWSMVLLVPLLWVMNVGVIAREERYLERK